jgi:hypothetical protein
MSTPTGILFIADKCPKLLQCCKWDGYPTGQGIRLLYALKTILEKNKINILKKRLSQVVNISLESMPRPELQFNKSVGYGIVDMLMKNKCKIHCIDSEFVYNRRTRSTMVPWFYIVHLDKEMVIIKRDSEIVYRISFDELRVSVNDQILKDMFNLETRHLHQTGEPLVLISD